jgi:hypothetical protein
VSGHKPPSGDHANIIGGSINGQDVANNSLTGAKIVKFSGVDACTPTLLAKFGRICAGSDGGARRWHLAADYCSVHGLRLPTLSEAYTLSQGYDVPGVTGNERFWTDDTLFNGVLQAETIVEGGAPVARSVLDTDIKTVCVANPTN